MIDNADGAPLKTASNADGAQSPIPGLSSAYM